MPENDRDARLRPMTDIDAIRARRAALTTAKRRVQRYPHLGLDPDTKQPIGERWTVVYEVNDPIWREPHLYIDGLAVSRADAEFDAAAPADIDALLAEVERLQAGLRHYAAKLNYLSQQCDAEAEAADAQPGHALLANNYRTGARCYRNAGERLADYGLQEHGA